MTWKSLRRLFIPWMSALEGLLRQVPLPTFPGSSLWVTSDYSFDNPASDFQTIGLLLADPSTMDDWLNLRNDVRERYLRDSRSMSWKKLAADHRREAAFIPFLEAANHINGLAITLAFHRDDSFQVPPDGARCLRNSLALTANWKPRNFENMFRVAYCVAMMVAGLSNPGQNIHWLSDEDSILANDSFESDTTRVFTKLLQVFLPHGLGEVRYNTTARGEDPLFQEDLVGVPDLMCGATCEIITAIKRKYTDIPENPAEFPGLAKRSLAFLDWYARGPCPLKRYICTFEGRSEGVLRTWILPPNLLLPSHRWPEPA